MRLEHMENWREKLVIRPVRGPSAVKASSKEDGENEKAVWFEASIDKCRRAYLQRTDISNDIQGFRIEMSAKEP